MLPVNPRLMPSEVNLSANANTKLHLWMRIVLTCHAHVANIGRPGRIKNNFPAEFGTQSFMLAMVSRKW